MGAVKWVMVGGDGIWGSSDDNEVSRDGGGVGGGGWWCATTHQVSNALYSSVGRGQDSTAVKATAGG
ncbi:hypothetical protein Tco_0307598 [Tanacetum coccineum]